MFARVWLYTNYPFADERMQAAVLSDKAMQKYP